MPQLLQLFEAIHPSFKFFLGRHNLVGRQKVRFLESGVRIHRLNRLIDLRALVNTVLPVLIGYEATDAVLETLLTLSSALKLRVCLGLVLLYTAFEGLQGMTE